MISREAKVPLPEGAKIAFLGAGNMAEAIFSGLLRKGVVGAAQVIVSDVRDLRLESLVKQYGVTVARSNAEAVAQANIVVLAVKPQSLASLLAEIRHAVTDRHLVISVAAGVTLGEIERGLGVASRLVRSMPNVCAMVGEAATAIAAGSHVHEGDVGMVKTIFEAVGLCLEVDENLMDAVTGLSGSGPAYLFLIIDALADAGVKVGLPREEASQLAAQTVKGAAEMLLRTGEHPGRLKDMVTSPGGTAIAGVATLEAGGLRTTLINAVETATRRAGELGRAREASRG